LAVSWFRPSSVSGEAPGAESPRERSAVPGSGLHGSFDDLVARSGLSPSVVPIAAPNPSASPSPPVPASSTGPSALSEPIDPIEEMREADRLHEERHAEALRRHRSDPRDPRWADATEPKIEADLAKAAERSKFKIVRVDCRMASCVSVLEWDSYPAARSGLGMALREPYSVNCGLEVLLPPPLNPAAPYQADMIFDCESWRADGN
jgi:hypothetical protein